MVWMTPSVHDSNIELYSATGDRERSQSASERKSKGEGDFARAIFNWHSDDRGADDIVLMTV